MKYSDRKDLPYPHFGKVGPWKLTDRGSKLVDLICFAALVVALVIINLV